MYIGSCYVSEQTVLLIIGHHDQKDRLLRGYQICLSMNYLQKIVNS
jgi:hypothetical protein